MNTKESADGVASLVEECLARCWHGLTWRCEAKIDGWDVMLIAKAEIVVNGTKHIFHAHGGFDWARGPQVACLVLNIGSHVKRQVDEIVMNGDAFDDLLRANTREILDDVQRSLHDLLPEVKDE